MGRWRQDAERWLASEHDERDDAAETAFAQLFAALPAAEPAPDFVERAVAAAWRARARRRRTLVLVRTAASLVLAAAGLIAYAVISYAGAWIVGTGASVVSRSAVWLAGSVATSMEWWSASARAGNSVVAVLAMPQAAAALIVMELVGAAALYALHRLLRGELTFRNSGPLCI